MKVVHKKIEFNYNINKTNEKYRENNKLVKKNENKISFYDIKLAFENKDNDYSNLDNINNHLESDSYNNKLKNQNIKKCTNCDSELIHFDSECGKIVCSKCGNLNGTIINNNLEWQNFNKNTIYLKTNYDRCGNTTTIGKPNASPNMVLQGINPNSLLGKIHRWNEVSYKEKNMFKIYKYMELKCKNIVSQKTINYAFQIYKSIYSLKIFRGDIRKAILAACIYYSSNINEEIIIEEELEKCFNINRKVLLQGNKLLNNLLYENDIQTINIKLHTSNDFITKFSKILDIDNKFIDIMNEIITNIQNNKLIPENNPKTKATSVIFLISCINQLGITKKKISTNCKISEVTIYKCYTKLLDNIDLILDKSKLNETQKNNLNKLLNKRYKKHSK
jgi:transcription initiation factor TFIIIB Brf1 subunit/transcription initiation factor TFIIB